MALTAVILISCGGKGGTNNAGQPGQTSSPGNNYNPTMTYENWSNTYSANVVKANDDFKNDMAAAINDQQALLEADKKYLGVIKPALDDLKTVDPSKVPNDKKTEYETQLANLGNQVELFETNITALEKQLGQ